jgi:hypothetical protein
MPANKIKKKPELKVVFDSNVIYTGSASELLNYEIVQLIKDNSRHSDLTIQWCLPELVVKERRYQMIKRGLELLPSIEKLERLIGHNFAITQDIIESHIQNTINNQISQYNLEILLLNTNNVKWDILILDSVSRKPPFDPGDKEKGFRDRIILETFLQLVQTSPSTPRICRVILVTGDDLLKDATLQSTKGSTNVRILSSIDDLKGLIDSLVAKIDEKFIKNIQEQAAKHFFEKENKESFYYNQNIRKSLSESYHAELETIPQGADSRQNGTWYISKPRFIKKEGQRITWLTRITVEATALKYELPPFRKLLEDLFRSQMTQKLESPDVATSIDKTQTQPIIISKGKTIFEVVWSISVSTSQKFSKLTIESLKFIDTIWESQ